MVEEGATSIINKMEAEMVLCIYRELVSRYPHLRTSHQIAIISPYSAQVPPSYQSVSGSVYHTLSSHLTLIRCLTLIGESAPSITSKHSQTNSRTHSRSSCQKKCTMEKALFVPPQYKLSVVSACMRAFAQHRDGSQGWDSQRLSVEIQSRILSCQVQLQSLV